MSQNDPLAEKLAEFRERYTNRRTVPWELLNEAEGLIHSSAEYHKEQLSLLRHAHANEITRLKDDHSRLKETLQSTIESQRGTIDSLKRQVEERRSLHEARRSVGDEDAEVTIRRDDYLKAWRLSDLEEIAFRLRCGGGTDDTPVDMASNRATAVVPAPNMVTLQHRPTTRPKDLATEPVKELVKPGSASFWRSLTYPPFAVFMICLVALFLLEFLHDRA